MSSILVLTFHFLSVRMFPACRGTMTETTFSQRSACPHWLAFAWLAKSQCVHKVMHTNCNIDLRQTETRKQFKIGFFVSWAYPIDLCACYLSSVIYSLFSVLPAFHFSLLKMDFGIKTFNESRFTTLKHLDKGGEAVFLKGESDTYGLMSINPLKISSDTFVWRFSMPVWLMNRIKRKYPYCWRIPSILMWFAFSDSTKVSKAPLDRLDLRWSKFTGGFSNHEKRLFCLRVC